MNIYELEQNPANMKAGVVKNRTRNDLKEDILTGLGAPTIKIALTENQLDQAINSALRQFWTHHRDGSFENFYFVQVTEEIRASGFVKIPEFIDAIIEVLPRGFGSNDAGFTSWEWQMQAAAVPGSYSTSNGNGSSYTVNAGSQNPGGAFGSVQKLNRGMLNQFSFSDYMIAKQSIDTMKAMIGSNTQVFNYARYQRRLYLRFPVSVGQFVAFRCSENVDPDRNPETCGELFDDETLKNLATANAKVIWGSVLRKFGGITLPGGVTLEGDYLVEEGNAEQEQIIKEMADSQPIDFFIG